jgi:hypothetical protein
MAFLLAEVPKEASWTQTASLEDNIPTHKVSCGNIPTIAGGSLLPTAIGCRLFHQIAATVMALVAAIAPPTSFQRRSDRSFIVRGDGYAFLTPLDYILPDMLL